MRSIRPPVEENEGNADDSKDLADRVERARHCAVARAIQEHHRAGNPVPIWRDGRIVMLYPDGSVRPV